MISSWLNTTANIDILDIIDSFSILISNIVFSISQQPICDFSKIGPNWHFYKKQTQT